MTPKEKADELIKKFNMNNAWGELEIGQKIDYALITVNEIIKDYHGYRVKHYLTFEHALELAAYWEEVKTELETL